MGTEAVVFGGLQVAEEWTEAEVAILEEARFITDQLHLGGAYVFRARALISKCAV